jgi:putative oxidoreductase
MSHIVNHSKQDAIDGAGFSRRTDNIEWQLGCSNYFVDKVRLMLFRRLVHTTDDHVLSMLRLVLGVVFFAHGAQKMFGWFGGSGYDATMRMFTERLGIPAVFAVLAILAEFLGGIGLIVGLFSRIAAFGIAVNMVVAVVMVHAPNGLFMNWQGKQAGEGYEYHLLVIAMAVFIAARGAGAWSLDRVLDAWFNGGRTLHVHMEPRLSS